MTERPINFSGDMVRAILDNRKTVTRRPVKPQPLDDGCWVKWEPGRSFGNPARSICRTNTTGLMTDEIAKSGLCPFGVPGDRMWVRETWRTCSGLDKIAPKQLPLGIDVEYSDGNRNHLLAPNLFGKRRSRQTMPRWASRITLENERVWVEKLLDITEAGARAEGFESVETFLDFWDAIYASKGFGRDANPWVWVGEFKRVEW